VTGCDVVTGSDTTGSDVISPVLFFLTIIVVQNVPLEGWGPGRVGTFGRVGPGKVASLGRVGFKATFCTTTIVRKKTRHFRL
jgi:hypothetical protein